MMIDAWGRGGGMILFLCPRLVGPLELRRPDLESYLFWAGKGTISCFQCQKVLPTDKVLDILCLKATYSNSTVMFFIRLFQEMILNWYLTQHLVLCVSILRYCLC